MAHLSLSLLGPFQVTLDGRPVTGFKSNKVRALLAYLAVEADRPHRRELLAGLLWPDWPDRDALANLRYALSNLRHVIGDRARPDGRDAQTPFLLVTYESLQFNALSHHWLDVAAFTEMVDASQSDPGEIDRLEQAVTLYRGGFLEGFSVGDSPAFEEWALFTREQIVRQVSSALYRLAAGHERRGDYVKAQSYAWRQLELEPWDERAHRQLMRALAFSGQRSAALVQYETCRRVLSEELGVEPGEQTTRLYQAIRDGSLGGVVEERRVTETVRAGAVARPPFLGEAVPRFETPAFVARERELARLDGFLEAVLGGQGRVVFVIGEAGSGKTALMQAFTQRAQETHRDLLVAGGNGSAYTGIGDPYLPFRQILGLLTGDVEAQWAAGGITSEHARRLWSALPIVVEAIAEHGPDLIDALVPGRALLERAALHEGLSASAAPRVDWVARLDELLARKPTGPGVLGPQQIAIFEQYSRVLRALALHAPLMLMLDDLQWADAGSISLLFHICRQLAGSRVLILGTYRAEEVAIGRGGERHPLEPVVNELRREFGDIVVNLGQADRREFVEALVDSEPNRLGRAFQEMLYRQTDGHPLFTVELLRGLEARGDLVRDPEGRWVEGAVLDWETLPERVEAVIAERIGRLAQPLRDVLQVASVEGEVFTAEVVAWVRGSDERELVGWLSGELDRAHRLVRAQSILRTDGQVLSRYQFRHLLFQRYLYGSLDEVERVHLHQQVGQALEGLYESQEGIEVPAVQLALHFQKAGLAQKAIQYLHQAGDRAIRLSAYPEAIAHLNRGLALFARLSDSAGEGETSERAEQELALQLSLSMARMGGIPGPEWVNAVTRARELCLQMGKTCQLSRVLGDLAILHYVRAEHQKARELAVEALSLAEQAEDPILTMLGHWYLGFVSFTLAEYTTARAHLGKVISFYDPQHHHRASVSVRGLDVGVSALAYDASNLWCLGYPDQASERSSHALALARELNHPFTLADAVCFGGCVFNRMRRSAAALEDNAEELLRVAEGMGSRSFLGTGICYWGEALTKLGRVEEGLAQLRRGLAIRDSVGARCHSSGIVGALAEAQTRAGHSEQGLMTLAEALALADETDERCYEPELRRVQGELLLARGDSAGAESSFQAAVEVARRQSARSWELRATVSLCRLWQQQGRAEEARQRLADIYGWFTEGLDTPDLIEARTLLDALGRSP